MIIRGMYSSSCFAANGLFSKIVIHYVEEEEQKINCPAILVNIKITKAYDYDFEGEVV